MIGTKIYKPIDENLYRDCARWCYESQSGMIMDAGEFYEVVPIPSQTPEQIMSIKKENRASAVKAITVEVDGLLFDGDEKSQDRMARAITMFNACGLPSDYRTSWVLADSTIAQVSVSQLAQALLLAGQRQTELWIKPYES